MKTLAKVLIILGMVIGGIAVIPLVVGILALVKLNKAKSKKEIIIPAILVLVFGNILAGIVMLLISEKSFENGKKEVTSDNSSVQTTVTSSSSSFSKVLIPLISVVAVIGIALLGVGGFGIYKLAFEKQEVSFNTNGGSIVETVKVKKNDKVLKPQDPVKEGHTFLGWYYQGQEWSFIGYSVTEDITLEAKWQINQYTITFDTDGGTQIPSITQDYGTAVEKPQYPTKEGYVFSYWELNGEQYELDVVPSKNITLVAKYKTNVYKVYFDENGGSQIKDITCEYNSNIKELIENPVKEGYTFLGWSLEHEKFDFENSKITMNLYLEAKWEANKHKVTLLEENGKVFLVIDTYYDELINLESIKKDGHTLIGWYYNNEEIDNLQIKVKEDITLVGQWQINQYTITFDTDGGTQIPSITQDYGTRINTPEDPQKYYHKFLGWDIEIPVTMPSYNITIYAKWENLKIYDPFSSQIFEVSNNKIIKFNSEKTEETTIYVPGCYVKNRYLETISSLESKAFSECINLVNIILPDTIINIGEYAFNNCINLKSITIPESVTNIDNSAFYGCSKLENIYYEGTIEDWCNIEFGDLYSNPMYYAKHFYMLDENNEYYEVTEIEIPNTITSLRDYQFYGFCYLEELFISNSATSIGLATFFGCNSLKSVVFNGNSNLNSIGSSAFSNCDSLISISIPESVTSIGEDAFKNCRCLTSVVFNGNSNLNSIGSSAFSNCDSLISISIPESVTSIGEDAFENCRCLTSVVFNGNSNLNSIENYTFSNCESLISIAIPNKVKTIGEYSFYCCTSLTDITIPESVISIGYSAFSGCEALSYNIYDNAKYLGNENNQYLVLMSSLGTSIENCEINEKTRHIYDNAFYNCYNLTNITIPESVISIGEDAFYKCYNLISITLPFVGKSLEEGGSIGYILTPSSLKEVIVTGEKGIESSAFFGCENLVSLTIPCIEKLGYLFGASDNDIHYGENNVPNTLKKVVVTKTTKITSEAFYGCAFIEEIILKNDKKNADVHIGVSAFEGCTNLTSITIPDSVTSIGTEAFSNCISLKNVYYNGTIEDWCNINFSGHSANPMNYGEHFYMLDENDEYYEVTEIELPSSVDTVSSNTFSGFENLESIVFSDNVSSIGEYAFSYCTSLTNVVFGENSKLKSIGYSAFNGCTSLINIEIPENVTVISWAAFENCNKIESISMPFVNKVGYLFGGSYYSSSGYIENNFRNHIPNTLKEIIIIKNNIGESAFEGCENIISVSIPSDVNNIGEGAFSDCNKLENVYYNGTIEDWCNISFTSTGSNPMNYAEQFYMLDENNEYYEVTEIEIPNTITKIGNYQFLGFDKVLTISIPDSVTSIGEYGFCACKMLTKIVISEKIISIGDYAFGNCHVLTINCKANSKPSGWSSKWNYSNRPVVWGYKGE